MNIGVIGGGAVGLLIASYLASSHQVTVYVRRKEQMEKINEEGLFLHAKNLLHVKANIADTIDKEDLILICVKQYHLNDLLPNLRSIDENTPLIFLQNGMRPASFYQKFKNPVFLGIVEHGVWRKEENKVLHTGKGRIKISPYRKMPLSDIKRVEKLDQSDFPIKITSNWRRLLEEKLMMNLVINPLTALFHVKNREIIENNYLKTLAYKLCEEAAQTLGYPVNMTWEKVQKIAEQTGNNYSSMYVDIMNEQKTEIDYISGYLLSRADPKDLPYTFFVYQGIRAIEKNYEG